MKNLTIKLATLFLCFFLLLSTVSAAQEKDKNLLEPVISFFKKIASITGFAAKSDKEIGIELEFKSGTNFDPDDNGVETIDGAVDITVENTEFNWDVDEEHLCTKWETYSVDDKSTTIECYGSEKCCNFIELAPMRDSWDSIFYSNFYRDGASYSKKISAQVMHIDYSLDPQNPYSEIYNSKVKKLNVRFEEPLLEGELCDGIDNDEDGLIDEELTRQCGETDIGSCEYGAEECIAGNWGKCQGSVEPDEEVCDSIDNDCDGLVDENLLQTCGTNEGICVTGTQTCSGGEWLECAGNYIGPSEEVCDGLDNDCNGDIDELECECEEGEERPCGSDVGVCESGIQECFLGRWGDCEQIIEPGDELCDALDNDCDGEIDEDITRECGDYFLGACEKGTQTCAAGEWSVCEGAVNPAFEVCDAVDNDCDGIVDESLTKECGANDTQTCSNGKWSDCEEDKKIEICHVPPGNPENRRTIKISINAWPAHEAHGDTLGHCNGTDMPCPDLDEDGFADILCNGFDCDDNNSLINPNAIESCNNIDDDCDGLVDEELTELCGETDVGVCSYGIKACSAGDWGECVGEAASSDEICNNLDDDCDGEIDEELTQACGTNIGECVAGMQTCLNGQWLECAGAVASSQEVCDGLDNNCDSFVDNGVTCECADGQTQQCGTDVGECAAGYQVCENNAWGPCLDRTEPTAESCDGLDNDCNGLVDEGLTKSCGSSDIGACTYGAQTCDIGEWGECIGSIEPVDEVCDNALDDNCDGYIDEGCIKPKPGKGRTKANVSEPIVMPSPGKEPVLGGGPRKEIRVEIVNPPGAVDINDNLFPLQAVVENKGETVSDVTVTADISEGWRAEDISIGSLKPDEKKIIILELSSELYSLTGRRKEQSYAQDSIDIQLNAETSGMVVDSAQVSIPLNIPDFSMGAADKDYSVDNELDVCFFINNKKKEAREMLEIEFELYDQKNDLIVDFMTPVKAKEDEVLIKCERYNLEKFPLKQKIYNTRSYLYEGGSVFTEAYVAGRSRSTVDLSEFEAKKWSFEDFILSFFTKRGA